MPLCEPWVDAFDVDCAGVTDLDVLGRAVAAASNALYALSGRQYSGLCTDVVRPCRRGDGCWAYGAYGAFEVQGVAPHAGCLCTGPVACTRNHDAVPLPHLPVVSVTEVLVDGAALVEDWVIVDDRWVVRRSPERWPATQYLDRPATEAGTWQVTYLYGTAVPADGVEAARQLACELAKGWTGGDCVLPAGVTSVIAENVSYDLAPVSDAAGLGGRLAAIPAVDLFLRARNPHRLARRGRLINPRDHRPRRMRRVRPGSSAPLVTVFDGGNSAGAGVDTVDGGDSTGTGPDTIDGGAA